VVRELLIQFLLLNNNGIKTQLFLTLKLLCLENSETSYILKKKSKIVFKYDYISQRSAEN